MVCSVHTSEIPACSVVNVAEPATAAHAPGGTTNVPSRSNHMKFAYSTVSAPVPIAIKAVNVVPAFVGVPTRYAVQAGVTALPIRALPTLSMAVVEPGAAV